MLKIENWGNCLLVRKDHSKFTKYCSKMPIGLSSLELEPHKKFINGKYLKKYFRTMWEMLDTAKKNYSRE